MGIYTDIASALASRLNGVGIPIAFENAPFKPTAGVTYLREAVLFGDNSALGISRSDIYTGVYQVDVMAPKDKGKSRNNADAVRALFSRGLRLSAGDKTIVIMQSSVGPSMADADRWKTPVSIEFRVIA